MVSAPSGRFSTVVQSTLAGEGGEEAETNWEAVAIALM